MDHITATRMGQHRYLPLRPNTLPESTKKERQQEKRSRTTKLSINRTYYIKKKTKSNDNAKLLLGRFFHNQKVYQDKHDLEEDNVGHDDDDDDISSIHTTTALIQATSCSSSSSTSAFSALSSASSSLIYSWSESSPTSVSSFHEIETPPENHQEGGWVAMTQHSRRRRPRRLMLSITKSFGYGDLTRQEEFARA